MKEMRIFLIAILAGVLVSCSKSENEEPERPSYLAYTTEIEVKEGDYKFMDYENWKENPYRVLIETNYGYTDNGFPQKKPGEIIPNGVKGYFNGKSTDDVFPNFTSNWGHDYILKIDFCSVIPLEGTLRIEVYCYVE